MANRFDRSAARLAARRSNYTARPIVYRRGESTVELSAGIGQTDGELLVKAEVAVSDEHVDFLVEAADLVLDGERIEPAAGDRISRTFDDGPTATYEVMPIGAEPAARRRGQAGRSWRVHARRVES